MPDSLPLFPLHLVLFPGGPLKLRIFETRYVDMIGRCMREGSEFGVAQIVSGHEVGGSARTAPIGTTARIVDFEQLQNGLLGITAIGERCFRIISTQQQPDGLHMADVVWLPAEPIAAVPPQHAHLVELLRRALPRFAPLYDLAAARYDDASWVSSRWIEILPLALPDKQRWLETQDPLQRLDYLNALVKTDSAAGTDS
jgi:uncharacterized protein